LDNFQKAKRKEKEATILCSLANPEPSAHDSSGSDDDDVIDPAPMRDHKLDNVIDSAISHINKKMKTNEYDHAVRETVLVSYSCIMYHLITMV
jgi:hypothetical protein